jgi:hypothetical protein
MSKATPAQRKKANSDRLWLIGGPIVLVLLLLLTTGPQILSAFLPRNVINARDLPQTLILK